MSTVLQPPSGEYSDEPLPCESRNDSYADIVERLFREFEDRLTLPQIVDVVRRVRHDLSDAPPLALPELVERLARQRLGSGAAH